MVMRSRFLAIPFAVLCVSLVFALSRASAQEPEYGPGWKQVAVVEHTGPSSPEWCDRNCLTAREFKPDSTGDIFLVNVETGQRTRVTSFPYTSTDFCSFDGSHVAYNRIIPEETTLGLWDFDVKTGKSRKLGRIVDVLAGGPYALASPTEKTLVVAAYQRRDFLHARFDLPGWKVFYFPRDYRARDDSVRLMWASDGSYFVLGLRDGRRDRVGHRRYSNGETMTWITEGKGKMFLEFYDSRGRLLKSLVRGPDDRFPRFRKATSDGLYWFGEKDGVFKRLNIKAGYREEEVPLPGAPVPDRGRYGFDISCRGEIAYEDHGKIWMVPGPDSEAVPTLVAEGAFPRFSPTGEYMAILGDEPDSWRLIVLKRDIKDER